MSQSLVDKLSGALVGAYVEAGDDPRTALRKLNNLFELSEVDGGASDIDTNQAFESGVKSIEFDVYGASQ